MQQNRRRRQKRIFEEKRRRKAKKVLRKPLQKRKTALPSSTGTRQKMLANSSAGAMIHTQSNAVVTSKIRARKTPKLIRSRVLSNAIAGKPVPPEVRKKSRKFCTLIFISPRGRRRKEFYHLFVHLFVENARITLCIFVCNA